MFFSSSLKSSAVNFIQDLLRRSPEARRWASACQRKCPGSASSQAAWSIVPLCPPSLHMLPEHLAECTSEAPALLLHLLWKLHGCAPTAAAAPVL